MVYASLFIFYLIGFAPNLAQKSQQVPLMSEGLGKLIKKITETVILNAGDWNRSGHVRFVLVLNRYVLRREILNCNFFITYNR